MADGKMSSNVNDFAGQFRLHRWPILTMTALVVTTLCACLVVVSTTPLVAAPKVAPLSTTSR
ncbi:MAG: hypothetical protein AAF714_00580 [Pseudomonadota bacterium]